MAWETKIVTTPPWLACQCPSRGYPSAFNPASPTIRHYPFILTGEEKLRESQVFCLRTQHNDSARSRTQTSRPRVQPIGHCVFHFTLEYKGLGRVVQSKIKLTEGHPTILDSVLLLYRQLKQFVLFSSVLLYTIAKLLKTWAVIYPKFNEKYSLNQFFESWITANHLLKNRPLSYKSY